MKMTARGEYGLRAMAFLASQTAVNPVPLEIICRETMIPRAFLAQIMLDLRRAQLVTSVRGQLGGYRLAKDPMQISVRDVVGALAEDFALVECLLNGSCDQAGSCLTRDFWLRAQQALVTVMEKTRLADLQPRVLPPASTEPPAGCSAPMMTQQGGKR